MNTLTESDSHRLVEDLLHRVQRLESEVTALRKDQEATKAAMLPSQDVVLAISAAVAAYLGKRATVRQIRFARSSSWSQQGRTAVQSSHRVQHGHAR
ncbi:MAG: methylmalonyl-CoA carboxyltransferase subunit [Actinomycetota bacterium]|nr:methylmalonyl-CoA carboxyltransferase subunit [Actinomycetota bacterium]